MSKLTIFGKRSLKPCFMLCTWDEHANVWSVLTSASMLWLEGFISIQHHNYTAGVTASHGNNDSDEIHFEALSRSWQSSTNLLFNWTDFTYKSSTSALPNTLYSTITTCIQLLQLRRSALYLNCEVEYQKTSTITIIYNINYTGRLHNIINAVSRCVLSGTAASYHHIKLHIATNSHSDHR